MGRSQKQATPASFLLHSVLFAATAILIHGFESISSNQGYSIVLVHLLVYERETCIIADDNVDDGGWWW